MLLSYQICLFVILCVCSRARVYKRACSLMTANALKVEIKLFTIESSAGVENIHTKNKR